MRRRNRVQEIEPIQPDDSSSEDVEPEVDVIEPKDDADKPAASRWFGRCQRLCGCGSRWCRKPKLPQYTALQWRKRLRIFVLSCAMIVNVVFVIICLTRFKYSSPVQVSLSEPLEIEISNCKMVISVTDPSAQPWYSTESVPKEGSCTVWYFMAAPLRSISSLFSWSDGPGSSGRGRRFSLVNDVDVVPVGERRTESCLLHLLLRPGAAIDSLSVTCKGQCIVTTDAESTSEESFWNITHFHMDTSAVTVASPLLLRKVNLGSLDLNMSLGDVYLEDATIQNTSSVAVAEGNFYTQLRNDVSVEWTSSTSFYCLAAPSMPQVMTSGDCSSTYTNATTNDTEAMTPDPNGTNASEPVVVPELASDCDGTASLCAKSTECNPGSSVSTSTGVVPHLKLSVPKGSFYLTRREFSSQAVTAHPGAGFNTTNEAGRLAVTFNGASQIAFQLAKLTLSDPARTDSIYTIEGPPMVRQLRPSNGFLYSATPSKAHAELGPWWLAFFSWGLLVRSVTVLQVDLRTAPCPYSPLNSLDSIGDIDAETKAQLLPDDNHVVAYITQTGTVSSDIGKDRPFKFEHETLDWANFMMQSENWWLLRKTGDGHFSALDVDLASNTTLVVALVLSLIVSALISGIIQYFLQQLLSTAVLILRSRSSHIKRYEKVVQAQVPSDDDKGRDDEEALPAPGKKQNHWKKVAAIPMGVSRLMRQARKEEKEKPSMEKHLSVVPAGRSASSAGKDEGTLIAAGSAKGIRVDKEISGDGKEEDSAVKYVLGRSMEMLSIRRLPPMFTMVDHAVFLFQRSYLGDSLDDFLKQDGVVRVSTEPEDATTVVPPTLTRFKDVYSKYCFLLKKEEHHLRCKESIGKLQKHGFRVEPFKQLDTPDAFVSIRFKTEREMGREEDGSGDASHMMMPGENSIDFFLRDRCKITQFDQDKILVDAFKAKYVQFCQQHRLTDPVTVSKALMAQKKITTQKVPTFRIVPDDDAPASADDAIKIKILDISQADLHNNKIIREHQQTNENEFMRLWWAIDIVTVFCHVILLGLLAFFPVPFMACVEFSQISSYFSTKEPEVLFHVYDLIQEPSIVLTKLFNHFPYLFLYLAVIGCLQALFGYVELLIYYGGDEFIHQGEFALSDSGDGIVRFRRFRRVVHVYQWVQCSVTIVVSSFLLGQFGVWCILGAMLNPNAFLAYATAVMTFITFATAKYAQIKKLFNMSFDEIVASTQGMVNESINRTLKTLIEFGGSEISGLIEGAVPSGLEEAMRELDGFTGGYSSGVLTQHVMRLAGGRLGKNFMAAGFDISTVVGVATGQTTALEAFAEQSNVPIEIVTLVGALADGDSGAIIKAISELLQKYQPSSFLAPELVTALAELAFHPTRPKVDKCIKALYRHVFPSLIRLWVQHASMPKDVANEAEALAQHAESGGGLEADIHVAKGLLERMLNGQGPTADEQELLKAKTLDTLQKAVAERPELLRAIAEVDASAAESRVRDLLGDQGLRQKLLDGALDTALTLLKGPEEVKKQASDLLLATTAKGGVEALVAQGSELAREVVSKLAEAATKELQQMLTDSIVEKFGLGKGAAAVLGGMMGSLSGFTPEKLQAVQELLMGVLPPLMKGVLALAKELDYQSFVDALRFVHSSILQQRVHFVACFGDKAFVSFESLGPIFHMLDLALGTEQVQGAIMKILEDANILGLPLQVTKFLQLVLWFRVPSSRQQAVKQVEKAAVQNEFMVSWSSRRRILEESLTFFNLNKELLILMELLMAIALDDIRALTNETIGDRLAECAVFISGMPTARATQVRELLGECFQVAMGLLATLELNDTSHMYAVLQSRTGLDLQMMSEVLDLCVRPEVERDKPPANMAQCKLLKAAAAHVGLEIKEAVGFAHLLMGHSDTPEVALLLHKIVRRQDLDSREVLEMDRLIISLLAISFSKSDQSVMFALQELRIKNRFLSTLGLGTLPPRYVSEFLLRSVGIKSEEVLHARLEVPFQYETDPNAWEEWLDKAASCIRGDEHLGPWNHIESLRNKPPAAPGLQKGRLVLREAHARRERKATAVNTLVQARRRERAMKTIPMVAARFMRTGKQHQEPLPPNFVPSPSSSPVPVPEAEAPLDLDHVTPDERELLDELMAEEEEEAENDRGRRPLLHHWMPTAGQVLKSTAAAVTDPGQMLQSTAMAIMAIGSKQNRQEPESPQADRSIDVHDSGERPMSRTMQRLKQKEASQPDDERDDGPVVTDSRTRSFQSRTLTTKMRMDVMQLHWLANVAKEQMVRDIVEHYNHEVEDLIWQAKRRAMLAGLSEDSLPATDGRPGTPGGMPVSKPGGKAGGKPGGAQGVAKPRQLVLPKLADTEAASIQEIAERELQELQDTHTGSLHTYKLTKPALQLIVKILGIEQVVKYKTGKDIGLLGKRRAVIQDFSDMLGVQSNDMTAFFNLICPERTRDIVRAVATVGGNSMTTHTVDALSQVTYSVRRIIPVFDEVRSMLWNIMWHFHMPRFLGPAVLLPSICHPPQMREVSSVVHFFMEPVLKRPECNLELQHSLYNIMGLVCGAPRNAESLLMTFGVATATAGLGLNRATAVDLLHMMLRPTASDKLLSMPRIIQSILKHASLPALADEIAKIFPYLVFFAGFPNAEVPRHLDDRVAPQPVLQIISEETGMPREVLMGVELSQRSISAMSQSDTAQFNRESVLGLLLPVMSAARRLVQKDDSLPSDGMVKALVSLAYCQIDHLEFLAEALNLDTFLLQFLIYLVDFSCNSEDSEKNEQTMQHIRVSTGIKRALTHLNLDHGKFVALLQLCFPCVEDIPSLQTLLDRTGLGQLISGQVMGLIYTSVNCALLHLRGVCDPVRHEHLTDLVRVALDGVHWDLGFRESLVPLLGIRLFQGDFQVLRTGSTDVQLLLPFTKERDIAIAVCGVLSQVPPKFTYNPVVVTGAALIKLSEKDESFLGVKVKIYTDTPLPKEPVFTVRALVCNGSVCTVNPEEFCFAAHDIQRKSFVLQVTRLPQAWESRRLEVRWQACPGEQKSAAALLKERHRVASAALRELEEVSWYERIHWGGAACVWWDQLDVHPLFLLLAAGDISAIRLASDLLCLPDILLAFLLASISLAPADQLKPLLLADLVILPVIKKIVSRNPKFTRDQLKPPPLEKLKEMGVDPTPTDTMARRTGVGTVPAPDQLPQCTANQFGLTFLDQSTSPITGSQRAAPEMLLKGSPPASSSGGGGPGGGLQRSIREDVLQAATPLTPTPPAARPLTPTAPLAATPLTPTPPHLQIPLQTPKQPPPQLLEAADSSDDETQASGDEAEAPTAHARAHFPPAGEALMHDFADLAAQDLTNFPDALLQLYDLDGAQGDAFRTLDDFMGQALWLQWRSEQRYLRGCSESTFERAAIDCYEQLRGLQPRDCSPADELLRKWSAQDDNGTPNTDSGMPDNMHILLSLMLLQLFVLLEDEADLRNDPGCAPSAALMVCLSRLHQARIECSFVKGAMPAALAEQYLMPAMWGLEVHVRSRQESCRNSLLVEIQNTRGKEAPAWATSPLGGFTLPPGLQNAASVDDLPPDWEWERWQWPEDEIVDLSFRVAQVARLALGVAAPLSSFHISHHCSAHPTAARATTMRATAARPTQRVSKKVVIEEAREAAKAQSSAERGWDALLAPGQPAQFQKRELMRDLLDERAMELLMSFAACGANPNDGHYTIQQVAEYPRGPAKDIFEDKASIYDAMISMLATSFDEVVATKPLVTCSKGHALRRVRAGEESWVCQGKYADGGCLSVCTTSRAHEGVVYYHCEQCKDSTTRFCLCERCYDEQVEKTLPLDSSLKLQSVNSLVLRMLPSSEQLGLRAPSWAPTLCWHIGLDPQMTEMAVQVAHGFIEDHRGKLLRPCKRVFEAAAARLHLGRDKSGWALLQSICTKNWSFESAKVLAVYLGLMPEVVHGLIIASKPSMVQVKGWLDLCRILFGSLRRDAAKIAPQKAAATPDPAPAHHPSQADLAARLEAACIIFNDLNHEKRGTLVAEQRKWMDETLKAIIPALRGADAGDAGEQLAVTASFMLHLLSNQNTAAAVLMQDKGFLHEALGLSKSSAEHFKCMTLLAGNGTRELEHDMVKEAVNILTGPLVSHVLQKSESSIKALAIPDDSFCDVDPKDTDLNHMREDFEKRMDALLNCMFGLATQQNKFVLDSVKKILKLDTIRVLGDGNEKRGDRAIMELIRAFKKPMTDETSEKMIEKKEVRALCLLQSLYAIRRIRENSSKKKVSMANTKGAMGLSNVVSALQQASADPVQAVATGLRGGLRALLGPSSSEDAVARVIGGVSSLGEQLASAVQSASSAVADVVRWQGDAPAEAPAPTPAPATLEGRCPKGHRLTCLECQECGEWICSGEAEPGGCRSGLTALRPLGRTRSYVCEECGYRLCEKCYYLQFQIISGAQHANLNGLYIANKALRRQGGRFVFVNGSRFLVHDSGGYWCLSDSATNEGRCFAYLNPEEPRIWKEWKDLAQTGDFYPNYGMQRYREDHPGMVTGTESKAFHVMQHFFTAFVASDRRDDEVTQAFMQDLKAFFPVLAAAAVGRFDLMLTGLQKLVSERPQQSHDMQLLLDMLTLVGMNKELFYNKITMLNNGVEVSILPALVRRLFGNAMATPELESIVNKLFNLLVGVCVEAPVDLINKMIAEVIDHDSIDSLAPFAMKLIKGERTKKAAAQLIKSMRQIASQAAEGKSINQMRLFSRGVTGHKAPIDVILEAILDLLLPFLGQELRQPIYSLLEVLTELYDLSFDPTPDGFLKRAPYLSAGIASAIGAPKHTVQGVFALARGHWEEAIDLCKPFCDIDTQVLHEMMKFLPIVKKTVKSGVGLLENLKTNGNADYIKSRVKSISNNVLEHKGTAEDLFDLVDLDQNGSISLEEFRMCTVRLGFQLSNHRVLEVFSKCKKKVQSTPNSSKTRSGHELSSEEFRLALDYLQHRVATVSLSMMGRSWGWLVLKLVYLCLTLVLIFVFIFLAMTAFLSGGTFGAIVNSCMTIAAGLSLARKEYNDENSGEDQKKVGAVVEEIQDMIMNDQ